MSTLGFVMMCHTALDRAAEVARHWAERDCPVVIHLDKRVAQASNAWLKRELSDLENVRFCKRHKCEWGTWSLVQASQTGAEMMLEEFPGVRHVYLASGSCLPLRPVEELRAYLAARPMTDFIESVTIRDVDWTIDGLNAERFQLRFPFSWKRHRHLFDRYVELQRRVGFKRKMPEGLLPHLGSQWWCLSRQTLSAILQDPKRREFDGYFRRVWIPDESYYQTLVRNYSRNIESRSLTLSKFDFQGKPHVFYDDHLHLLRRSDCFVARKIWPRAERLYQTFLSDDAASMRRAEPTPGKIDRVFAKALERRTRGRPGLYMQSRFPNKDWENGKTAAPYSVLHGFNDLFLDFEPWLSRRLGTSIHGNLFDPKRVRFAGDAETYAGCLSAEAALRDYNPESFLTNLIWNTRGERQVFMFGPQDNQRPGAFIAADSNAQISVITGSWAVRLFTANRNFGDIRTEAARLQRREVEFVNTLRHVRSRAEIRIWSLAEFLEEPMENLQRILDAMEGSQASRLTEAPRMANLEGLPKFLQNLKNQGMNPFAVGDFPQEGVAPPPSGADNRPYLVR
ncbi:beta-1,6-N-acetylglucosaminyltransferase [Gymnodinialimonas ceratoperidinii]|uniref:Peptide O-xylosyltransferase n=1 Tax=Gymnodinialimonas ceratoperidinii TaxID=2856823 RepID=A0A8F6TYF3_9RHOB|nr:beta-1,6-N-acetylglucosaminyltransferase [Gymnodinialimonas ceratoperidinii]QXT40022.1 beta-1,6-N-acetylglucosaminyltransferase [Gymnodinialimonas ceratoperidinii]